jgi:leucyl/phenylalanyl-tRNA--protein transferase
VRCDTAFERVIEACAGAPRPGQDGTWITQEIMDGFTALHARGLAHSVETWREGELVGGLYGIGLGRSFCGESMFSHAPDASKVATVTLLGNLRHWGFSFVDCQVYTDHLARFGAQQWPRTRFLTELRRSIAQPTRRGRWDFELDPEQALGVC